MSQTDLQNLLFNALASGSHLDAEDHREPAAALAARCTEVSLERTDMTPSEVIAHYDFRVRSSANDC
jgi:hypothetical protein